MGTQSRADKSAARPIVRTGSDKALYVRRTEVVAAYLKSEGLTGRYLVRGEGVAKQMGATARRVNVSITYQK